MSPENDQEQCEGILVYSQSAATFGYIGLLLVIWITFKLIRSLWRALYTCILADLLGYTIKWKKLGSWAVITGSSDGIGKAYAKALAAKSFNVVLISRTKEKLEAVAQEIQKKHNVKTKVIPIDVTGDLSGYEKVREAIEGLEIGVLVNNVGMSYKYAEYLTKVTDGEQFAEDLIKANILSVTKMTQMVLPKMERQKKGVIINLSSLSALSPVPLLSMYSASKAYVDYFTQATCEEYKRKGIIIQSVLPAFVSTNMTKMRPSFTTATPDSFVKWALKTVGVENRTYGYPVHKLQGYLQESLCAYLPERVTLSVMHRMMNDIRKRYYKKFGVKDTDEPLLTEKHPDREKEK